MFLVIACEAGQQAQENSRIYTYSSHPNQPDSEFPHPWKNAYTDRGVVLHDIKDSPAGRRFIIQGGIGVEGELDSTFHQGIKTIFRRKMTQEELDELVLQGQRGYPRHANSAPIISPRLETMISTLSQDATDSSCLSLGRF